VGVDAGVGAGVGVEAGVGVGVGVDAGVGAGVGVDAGVGAGVGVDAGVGAGVGVDAGVGVGVERLLARFMDMGIEAPDKLVGEPLPELMEGNPGLASSPLIGVSSEEDTGDEGEDGRGGLRSGGRYWSPARRGLRLRDERVREPERGRPLPAARRVRSSRMWPAHSVRCRPMRAAFNWISLMDLQLPYQLTKSLRGAASTRTSRSNISSARSRVLLRCAARSPKSWDRLECCCARKSCMVL
jgi:hypothetical protein